MARSHVYIVFVFLALVAGIPFLLKPAIQAPEGPGRTGEAVPAASGPHDVASAVSVAEAEELLRAGRPWRAAQIMREHLRRNPDAAPRVVLLAARAEGEWGGWSEVRTLLERRDWLAEEQGGEGLFRLARAFEADGQWVPAADAYRRFLAVAPSDGELAELRTIATMRSGLVLIRSGEVPEGLEVLAATRASSSTLRSWLDLLTAEAVATRGDTAAVRSLVAPLDLATFGHRARRARLIAYREAADFSALYRSAAEYRGSGSDAARAEFALFAGRAALRIGEPDVARAELRVAVSLAPRTSAALDAARELEEMGSPSIADRLAIARVYDHHNQKQRAVELYREWLAAGSGGADERRQVRLSVGRALFDLGSFTEAEVALRPLATERGTIAADALYLIGRVQFRAGRQPAARQSYLQVAERFPGSQQGAEALYLVADMHHGAGELGQAGTVYRRVADEFRGRDRAGLALMRLAGMAYLAEDFARAARLWNEYRTLYPRGQLWSQATYWTGMALLRSGDREAGMARFREVRARDRLSYYSLRAADHLGVAFWPVPLRPTPDVSSAAQRRVAEWVRTVDLLRHAELFDEADAESERLVRIAASDANLAYPLAEALNERGYTVRGIRLGLQIQAREGGPNARLLRILYPFPYRTIIEAESREMAIDPLLAAALIRQESMFSARISSPVGARGLMQIMPATGRAVADGLGIGSWSDQLLFQPEINVHLGTRYLAEQMRQYDGSLPSVFSAYNAGPHRVEEWRHYPEYSDAELFTERIPFRETRDYVKILTVNRAIYEGLYGQPGR